MQCADDHQRVVVDNVAGTTVDPVDELIELDGRLWRFIDTAGIRKRVKEASGHEYYAWLRTSTAIERAEVCVLVLAGNESVAEQDIRILQEVREAGKALIIAFNKWDLVDAERRYYPDREIERDLVQVQWAPRINITAMTADGCFGLPGSAPFDRIIVTAAAEDPPTPLLAQLKPGGIMILPVGQSDAVQSLIKVTRKPDGFDYEELRQVRAYNGVLCGQLELIVGGTEKAAYDIASRLQTIDGVVSDLNAFVDSTASASNRLLENSEARIDHNRELLESISSEILEKEVIEGDALKNLLATSVMPQEAVAV